MPAFLRQAARSGCCRNGCAAPRRRGLKKLQSQLAQAWMVRGPRSQRPQKLSCGRVDRHVVDARFAPAHQTMLIEFPLLIAVRAEPVAAVVVPFILKANRDAV